MGHMVSDPIESVRDKVRTIFKELTGERAASLEGNRLPASVTSAIAADLSGSEASEQRFSMRTRLPFI